MSIVYNQYSESGILAPQDHFWQTLKNYLA